MKKVFYIVWLLNCFNILQAQELSIKNKVDSLLDLSFEYNQINNDTAISMSRRAMQLAKKENYQYGYANAFARLSIALRFKGLYNLALEKADSAIFLSKNKHQTILASAFNNKGVCFRMKGEMDSALFFYQKTIDIYNKQEDTAKKAVVLNSIGVMFMYSDFPEKALAYYLMAEELHRQMGNEKGLADVFNNLAITYANSGKLDSALLFFSKSYEIEKKLGNQRGIVESYGNIGLVYFMQGELTKAIAITEEVIELEKKAGNIQGEIASYNSIAEMLIESGKIEEALTYLNRSLKTAKDIDSHTEIASAHLSMSNAYRLQGNYEEALKHYTLFHNQEDSAKSEMQQKVLAEMEVKFNTAEKERALAQEQIKSASLAKDAAEAQLSTSNRNKWIIVLVAIIIGVILLASILKQKNKQKAEAEKNAAIIIERDKGTKAVFEAQEEERKRISKDLHDGVGQQLSGLKMALQTYSASIDNTNRVEKEIVEKLAEIASDSADEVRLISHQMMPKALTELGLIEALEDMLEKTFSLSKINYSFEHFGIQGRLSENLEISLYRVAQELINNIIKHSNATKVNVQLFKNAGNIIMIVEDNGKGISNTHTKGHGLLNMKSRINTLNGDINLEPSPSSGTLATIRVPIV